MLHSEEVHSQERPSELGGNAPVCYKSGPPRQTFPPQIVLHTRDWKQPISQYSLKCSSKSRSFVVIPLHREMEWRIHPVGCAKTDRRHDSVFGRIRIMGLWSLRIPTLVFLKVVSETSATLYSYQGIDPSYFCCCHMGKVLVRQDSTVQSR